MPFLGWLVGAVLVVLSRACSGREKALGLAFLLLPVLLPLLVVVAEGSGSTVQPAPGPPESVGSDPGGPAHSERSTEAVGLPEIVALTFLSLGGLPTALYLGWRLRRTPSA